MIDALRCCKLALERGMGGTLEGPSAYFMKSPPVQHSDERARQLVEEFIAAPGALAPVGDGAAPTTTLERPRVRGAWGDSADPSAAASSVLQAHKSCIWAPVAPHLWTSGQQSRLVHQARWYHRVVPPVSSDTKGTPV